MSGKRGFDRDLLGSDNTWEWIVDVGSNIGDLFGIGDLVDSIFTGTDKNKFNINNVLSRIYNAVNSKINNDVNISSNKINQLNNLLSRIPTYVSPTIRDQIQDFKNKVVNDINKENYKQNKYIQFKERANNAASAGIGLKASKAKKFSKNYMKALDEETEDLQKDIANYEAGIPTSNENNVERRI